MSKRQSIINAIETRMKTILTTGGYETNIGQHVFVWRTTALADAELPAADIRDRDTVKNHNWSTLGTDILDLPVEIEAIASGSTTRTALRSAVADIRKAVKVDHTWGGLAKHTSIEADDIALEQGEKLTGSVIVRLRVVHEE